MEKINNIKDMNEGDHLLYRYKGKPMCIIRVAYSDGNGFIRYKLEDLLVNKEMDVFHWSDVNALRHLYKLDDVELLTYMM